MVYFFLWLCFAFVVAIIGDKRKILDLSLKNAIQFKFDRLKQIKIVDPRPNLYRIYLHFLNYLHTGYS